MSRPLRCLVGWHKWLDLYASGLTAGPRLLRRVCTRCGLAQH